MDNELEIIWKEVVVAYIKELSHNLPERAEKNSKKASLNITDVPTEIRTKNLLDKSHKRLKQLAQRVLVPPLSSAWPSKLAQAVTFVTH
jgi:hypothetical protein